MSPTELRSLHLWNDSTFPLKARIQNATGEVLLEQLLAPSEQKRVSFPMTKGKAKGSLTPISVLWFCPKKGFFARCGQVSLGASIRATGCSGSHFCEPEMKEDQKSQSSSTLRSQGS